MYFIFYFFFFFFSSRRRHTRSLRDWSSDVCSSDLRRIECVEVQCLLESRPLGRRFVREPGILALGIPAGRLRSEERRVGKECRSRLSPYPCKKKNEKREFMWVSSVE